jgi:hypothetical protein
MLLPCLIGAAFAVVLYLKLAHEVREELERKR